MKYPLKIVPHNCQPFNGKPCSSVSIEGIDSLFQHPMRRDEAEEIVKAVNWHQSLMASLLDCVFLLESKEYVTSKDKEAFVARLRAKYNEANRR